MSVLQPARGSDEAACPARLCGQCGVPALESHSLCWALMAPGLRAAAPETPWARVFLSKCLQIHPRWALLSPFMLSANLERLSVSFAFPGVPMQMVAGP